MKKYPILILVLSLVGIVLFCNIPKFLDMPPMSVHIWRQADCLSLTKNYMENPNFFEPAIHNYISEDLTSGKTAGEFPILYYFVGMIWKAFGESIFLYRLLGLLVYMTSIVYLFRTVKLLTKSNFWSYVIAILFFCSPVLLYYGISFLTNVYALSFVLIGWYFGIKYLLERGRKELIFFSIFILLAGLLKVTALLSLYALAGGITLDILLKKKIQRLHIEVISATLLISFLIFLWFQWAEAYNTSFGGKYTFNSIWPIWEMNDEQLKRAIRFGKEVIYLQMYNKMTWAIIWASFLALILNIRRFPLVVSSILSLFIGALIYCILWFSAFDAHDYYIINLMIFPLAALVGLVYILSKRELPILQSRTLKISASIFLLYNVLYLSNNIHTRFHKKLWGDHTVKNFFMTEYESQFWIEMSWVSNHYGGLYEMREELDQLGVKRDDLIIYIQDHTFNASLYLLDRKGWTSFTGNMTHAPEGIKQKIEKGAKYLIVHDKNGFDSAYLNEFMTNKIGEVGYREVFRLD